MTITRLTYRRGVTLCPPIPQKLCISGIQRRRRMGLPITVVGVPLPPTIPRKMVFTFFGPTGPGQRGGFHWFMMVVSLLITRVGLTTVFRSFPIMTTWWRESIRRGPGSTGRVRVPTVGGRTRFTRRKWWVPGRSPVTVPRLPTLTFIPRGKRG